MKFIFSLRNEKISSGSSYITTLGFCGLLNSVFGYSLMGETLINYFAFCLSVNCSI